MIAESLARRYAVALFNLAVERDELEQLNDEYMVINEVVTSERNFRYFLYSPKVSGSIKKQVLTEIFQTRVSRSMLHFLFLLIDKKRQTLFDIIYRHFTTLYDNFHNRAIITVCPALPLGGEILDDIRLEFERFLKKSISVEEKVDSSLIGGLQVRVHNTVYDASIRNRLRLIRKELV
ncbi:ATP synthase F1 subunit delta [candidate division KSB1 bacterium]